MAKIYYILLIIFLKINNKPIKYKTINKYKCKIELLGEGSFGKVYDCEKNKKNYVLKIIKNSEETVEIKYYKNHDNKFTYKELNLFENELFILNRINNYSDKISENKVFNCKNYFVNFIESFEINNEKILVFEKMDKDVFNLLEDKNKDFDLLKKIFVQGIIGLFCLKKMKIVHTDIKPENLFLKKENGDWNLKFGDFGLTEIQGIYHFGSGTPTFAAPEFHKKDKKYNYKFDMWSFGMTMLQLIDNFYKINKFYYFQNYKEIVKYLEINIINNKRIPDNYKEFIKHSLEKNTKKRQSIFEIFGNKNEEILGF